MAYIVPRVLINQEFTQVPVFSDQPLAALVFGPQYNLYRYSVSSEKAKTKVTNPNDATLANAYQYTTDTTYLFPNQVSGTIVDSDYTKVFFEKAELVYYPNDLASTAGAISRVAVPNSSKYYPNRLKADSLVFKTANGVDRSDDFSNRNVAPGDVVVITDETTNTFTTKVKALHYSKSAASLGSVSVDADNEPDQLTDINNAVVAGADNDDSGVTVANQTTAFDGGWVNGQFIKSETFTATVVTGGNLSAVRFNISSTNGLVGSQSTSNVALSSLTDVDELSLYTEGGNIVKLDFTGSTAFVVGNTYSVTVDAAIVDTYVPTAGGTYTGTTDTTYKLTVVRGGPFYNDTNADVCARIAVTSTGNDSSATVNVKASTAFNVGSYGVTATFASTSSVVGGLIEGDIYYIPAVAAAPAATNILEVYDSLPATFVDGSVDWSITSLRIVKDYEVSQAIPENDVDLNWTVDAAAGTVTINSGITGSDADILGLTDVPLQLNVVKANIFVEHRDLVVTNSISISSLNDTSEVEAALGTVHPDNPLAQGVYDAVLNAAGVTVYYCAVATNDLEGYDHVLSLAKKKDIYYGLVPLTTNRTIQDSVVAHVNAMSTAESAKWRVAWLSVPLTETALIYDVQSDLSDWLGTITDDPLTTDSNPAVYTLLTVEGATFVTDGVRATDRVLTNYRTNSEGVVVYDTYIVEEVRTETTLVLTSGTSAAVNVAQKVKIERVYTKDEQVDTLAAVGGDYNNRRVRVVFPGTLKQGSVVKEGFFAAAALAGLRSSVAPHQGLTNTEVLGFTDLTDSVITFNETQLNTLAAAGIWILTQEEIGATPYVRHQLTTDAASLNTSEDSITTNVDSISHGLQVALAPYIGKYNINPTNIGLIRQAINKELSFRQTQTFTVRAGNQLISYEIVSLSQNATFKDRLDAKIKLEVPYPLNFVELTLVV